MLEPRWTNFLLNCPPNRDGLMDAAIVTRLAEVGAMWSPNASRAPLPAQGPQNEYPYTPASAAATSGTAANAIDGINDYGAYTIWQSTASLPQSVTIDLGQSRPDVGYVGYVPRYVANSGPSTDGAITSYAILTSTDNTDVHDGHHRHLAGRRQDEVGHLRPGRRPLRAARGARGQRRQRRGRHRDHGRRAPVGPERGARTRTATRTRTRTRTGSERESGATAQPEPVGGAQVAGCPAG